MGLSLNYVIFGKCGWVVEAKEEIDYFAFQKDYLVEVVGGEMAKLIISAFNWITFKRKWKKSSANSSSKRVFWALGKKKCATKNFIWSFFFLIEAKDFKSFFLLCLEQKDWNPFAWRHFGLHQNTTIILCFQEALLLACQLCLSRLELLRGYKLVVHWTTQQQQKLQHYPGRSIFSEEHKCIIRKSLSLNEQLLVGTCFYEEKFMNL